MDVRADGSLRGGSARGRERGQARDRAGQGRAVVPSGVRRPTERRPRHLRAHCSIRVRLGRVTHPQCSFLRRPPSRAPLGSCVDLWWPELFRSSSSPWVSPSARATRISRRPGAKRYGTRSIASWRPSRRRTTDASETKTARWLLPEGVWGAATLRWRRAASTNARPSTNDCVGRSVKPGPAADAPGRPRRPSLPASGSQPSARADGAWRRRRRCRR